LNLILYTSHYYLYMLVLVSYLFLILYMLH